MAFMFGSENSKKPIYLSNAYSFQERAADVMLKNVKAGMIGCNGVAATRMGNFPGMQQQTSQPETPFEVAYDYFHIVNKGLK